MSRQKLNRRFSVGGILILVAGLGLATVMFFASKNALNLSIYYTPLIDAATQINFELSFARDSQYVAHEMHQNEEGISSLIHLKRALWYANTMLEGGDNSDYMIMRIKHVHQRQKMEAVTIKIVEIMAILEKNHVYTNQASDFDDEARKNISIRINETVNDVKFVETQLVHEFLKNLNRFQAARIIIILIVVVFSIIAAIAYDYFSRRKLIAERTLKESQQQLLYVVNGANLGFWDWNYQTGEHHVNDIWLQFLGLDRRDINNHIDDCVNRIHPDDKQKTLDTIGQYIKMGKPYVVEFRMKHKKGHWVWIQGSGAVVEYDEKNKALRICGTHQDITERKLLEKHLSYLATHDQLTQLYNRRVFEERLVDEINRSARYSKVLSIFLIDIDYFKNVNDSHGHEAGDTVLKNFADMLREKLRVNDITARYGGEEFAVILPETSAEEAKELAERFRQQIALTYTEIAGGEKINLTISIGIASYPLNGHSYELLIKAADMAMYRAKYDGRDRVVSAGK